MTTLNEQLSFYFDQNPRSMDKISASIARASRTATDEDYETIIDLVRRSVDGVYYLTLALCALPGWGQKGVETLLELAFEDNEKLKVKSRAMNVLLMISRGVVPRSTHVMFLDPSWDKFDVYEVSPSLANFCLHGLREKIFNALRDWDSRSNLLHMLGTMAITSPDEASDQGERLNHFFSLIIDHHLALNLRLIQQFELLLDAEPKFEEELQTFLKDHPVFLDPFVSELYVKQELGSDFITDYVIRRINDQYILVEIERSVERLFNKRGALSHKLSEAIGQVRDFKSWVTENLDYARKKLPNIRHPVGLVVIGRGIDLDDRQKIRLAEENDSRRGHIKIVTYDDLLATAKCAYRNMIERPIVKTSKETSSI